MWIEVLSHNMKEVVRLDGGNEYREGRGTKRAYRGHRKIGHLPFHSYLSDLAKGDTSQTPQAQQEIQQEEQEEDEDENEDDDGEFITFYGADGEPLATIQEVADPGDKDDEDLHLD
jgi:hypothetical protein